MSKKTCEAFFCTNKCNKKYRYCYDCAKSKGLIGNDNDWIGWIIWIFIIGTFCNWIFG